MYGVQIFVLPMLYVGQAGSKSFKFSVFDVQSLLCQLGYFLDIPIVYKFLSCISACFHFSEEGFYAKKSVLQLGLEADVVCWGQGFCPGSRWAGGVFPGPGSTDLVVSCVMRVEESGVVWVEGYIGVGIEVSS